MRWLTQAELDDYYISKALGRLAENGTFVFKHTGGWGTWPPETVKALLVLGRLEQEVDILYKEQAEFENSKEDKPAPPPPPPSHLNGLGLPGQANKQNEIGMTDPEVAKRKAASIQHFYAANKNKAPSSNPPFPPLPLILPKE